MTFEKHDNCIMINITETFKNVKIRNTNRVILAKELKAQWSHKREIVKYFLGLTQLA